MKAAKTAALATAAGTVLVPVWRVPWRVPCRVRRPDAATDEGGNAEVVEAAARPRARLGTVVSARFDFSNAWIATVSCPSLARRAKYFCACVRVCRPVRVWMMAAIRVHWRPYR